MALFDNAAEEATIESLVGEGKKFKTIDDLVKGKVEADRTIALREQEMATIRQELATAQATAELLQRSINTPQSRPPVGEPQQAAPAPAFTQEDLAERVKSVMQQTTAEQRKADNKEAAATKLLEVYGDSVKAQAALAAKAAELGVSTQWLESVAEQSPKAFFSQLGLNATASGTPGPSRGDVNTEAFSATRPGEGQPGTYKYYQNLMAQKAATDGQAAAERWFYSPAVQTQLMNDAFQAEKEGRNFMG